MWFLFHLLLLSIMSNFVLVKLKRCWRSSKFLFREHALIWNKESDLFFWGILMLSISSMSWCLDEEIFSELLLFSGVALLNWFTKSCKLEEGFNDNELSWSCSRSLHCVMLLSVFVQQARKFLLFDKELKGKIVLQQSIQYQDSSQFWRYL